MNTGAAAPVTLGIVGTGRIALAEHLPALRRQPRLRVVALCDTSPDNLARAAAPFPEAARYDDDRALLQHPGLQAVGVLTPPQSHAAIALRALDADLHVLIEKPLAITLDESEALLQRATDAGRAVVVGFNTRWHRTAQRARDLLQQGVLGDVRAVRSLYTHRMSARNRPDWVHQRGAGSGLLLGEAPHHLDFWRYLLQRDIEQVYALGQSMLACDDQWMALTARLSGGVLASAVLAAESNPTSEIEILGERGRLCASLYRADGLQLYLGDRPPGDLRSRLRQTAGLVRQAPQMARALRDGGIFRASFGAMWAHLAAVILDGAPVQCTLLDGHRALQATLAAAESARTGQPVKLTDAPRRLVMEV